MKSLNVFPPEFKNYYNDYFNKLALDFKNWLLGLQQDDPVPREIKLVAFTVSKTSSLYSLSFSGYESKLIKKLDPHEYYPLEAQYFFTKYLMAIEYLSATEKIKKEFILFLVKKLITKFLKEEKSTSVKNRKIAYGYLYEKPIYFN
jgi:hypothetical protein